MVMVTEPGQAPSLRSEPGQNQSNPQYPIILAIAVLCSIFTTVFTAIRLITKRLISTYGPEDYMLMAAWVASIAFDFDLLGAGLAGLGQHARYLRETELDKITQYSGALDLLYSPAIWLAKASLLFQLIRIFAPMKSGPVYWACHILIWGNLAFYISTFCSIVFGCHRISEFLKPSYRGHCVNRTLLLVISGAVNIFSDLLILLLPIWATWHLQMALKRKAGIIAIFATGILAFVSSICRLIYTIPIISSPEISYIDAQLALWGLAEITTIILCTCFPMMPRFAKLLSDRYSSSKSCSPSPTTNVRSLNIIKVGNFQRSIGITRGGPQEEGMARLKSPYQQLSEEGYGGSERKDVVRDMGSKKTVDIELATWDQLNTKSRVASIV